MTKVKVKVKVPPGWKRTKQGRKIVYTSEPPRVGGGDKSPKSESRGPHLARGSQHIYKHILFYWYPTKNAKMTPPGHAEVRPSPLIG